MRDKDLPKLLRDTLLALARQPGPDLTARQVVTLLTCYLKDGPHTVRGLAEQLNVAKPAITRALGRLQHLDLTERRQDPRDRRYIVVRRTRAGRAYMEELHLSMEIAEG